MKLLNDDRTQKMLVFIFLALQPFLDCYLLYSDKVISLFGFSPTTIIRLVFVLFMCIIVFFGKTNKKNKAIICVYLALILVYSVIHILYDYNLNITNYKEFTFSWLDEALYLVRMLIPIGMAFLAYFIKFSKKEFGQAIYLVLLTTSLVIIISNFFKISLPSYNSGTIKASIFSWFTNTKYTAAELASKGWFNSANQISGLFMLLLPIALGYLMENFSWPKVITIFCSCIAMLMLGTRTASYGWILNFICIIIVHVFFVIIRKKKINIKLSISLLVIGVVGCVILTKAPVVSDVTNEAWYTNYELAEEKINNKKLAKNADDLEVTELVGELAIDPVFYTEIYPVEEHEDFWKSYLFEIPLEEKYGQRNIQKLITQEVDQKQKDTFTPVLGYGYSRFTSVGLYWEHDILVHYYTIGVAGIILFLCPYLIIAIGCLLYMLIKRKMDFINIVLIISIIEIIALSIITGHILDELIVSIYMGFIMGYLLKRVEEDNDKTKS